MSGGATSDPPARGLAFAAPIVAVTVLEDRATVTRVGTIALAPGQHRLEIANVSPVVADKTLAATATGGARVLDVRCERRLVHAADRAELAPLEASYTRLAEQIELANAATTAARAECVALADLAAGALRDLAAAATRGQTAPDAAAQLAELDRATAAASARVVDGELAIETQQRALERLDRRIAHARVRTGTEVALLAIDVLVDGAGTAETVVAITTAYVVPGAAWRPYHRARLRDRQVDWQTTACVWQATGEDWIDADLTCSLERPSFGAEPPTLGDDELRIRKRPDHVAVETREQVLDTTGLGGGTAGAPEVPGIDDGGLGLTLSAAKVTVRADGAPHRIDVGGWSAPASLAYVAVPLRSPWVHLRARIANTGPLPLLAGPVDLIMESGYVGRAEVGFVAANEKLEIGFGPASDLRVHRSETAEREEAGILSGATAKTTRVAVRLSNLGTEKRDVLVTERVPVSEVEQVEVTVTAADGYILAAHEDAHEGAEITQVTARAIDERGLVTWSVELPAHGRRAVALEYRVKSARGVSGV